jgi:hypothetical protein
LVLVPEAVEPEGVASDEFPEFCPYPVRTKQNKEQI